MNVSSSITPTIGERLTGIQSKLQWADVGWNKVEEHVNRLQARSTKAVKEGKWHSGQKIAVFANSLALRDAVSGEERNSEQGKANSRN